MENIIPRAKHYLHPADFSRMFELCHNYKWLNAKSLEFCELWNMTDNESQKKLIEQLIKKFTYISFDYLDEITKLIAEYISSIWMLTSENAIITAICDNGRPDGSQTIVQNIKNKFRPSWDKTKIFSNILEAVHILTDNTSIILIDDFIGTGNTICRKIQYVKDYCIRNNIKNVIIKVVALAVMDFAQKSIVDANVEILPYFCLRKGIDSIPNEEERDNATNAMKALELKLDQTHLKRYRFGFENSQSLFSLGDNNVPNNVFPIFWWPSNSKKQERNTIFHRQL
ncbi:hypothetical protein [Alistipes finegoldii]|uniref:phosphoribosyltransferase-like protein n=1 Tax=Alistipes finegoldii TaxID=214856 RepID=UPI002494AC86|nr:hypothetical protein [Alistipes finegoldii]